MSIKFRGKKIGVEKLKKQSNKSNSLYKELETEEFLGIVKYSSKKADVKVGDKVYFGKDFQNVRMEGSSICIMDDDNVLAIEETDEHNEILEA